MVDRRPDARIPPPVELVLHRRRWREDSGRQHPPWQPAAQQIQQRLHDPPQAPACGAAKASSRGNKRRNQSPFRIGQITWRVQSIACMRRAGDIRPHEDFHRRSRNHRRNHKRLISLNFFFGQALRTRCTCAVGSCGLSVAGYGDRAENRAPHRRNRAHIERISGEWPTAWRCEPIREGTGLRAEVADGGLFSIDQRRGNRRCPAQRDVPLRHVQRQLRRTEPGFRVAQRRGIRDNVVHQ